MNINLTYRFLQEECQINPQAGPIIVGVSGGSDSVCLLHLLHGLGYPVVAIHLNHQIRMEASQDAAFVEEFCEQYQIPQEILVEDVPEYARKNHLSMEEAARVTRYRCLFESARKHQAIAVVTAHHAGDQAETVLMHFIRGSGLSGLRGMQPRSILPEYDPAIPLVRPLLYVAKQEILDYCQMNELRFITDASNMETTYFRNWLRNTLIPQIETRNPRFQETLLRTSISIGADASVLQDVLRAAWQKVFLASGEGYVQLSVSEYLQQPAGIARGIARQAIASMRPNLRDIDFFDVERFVEFVRCPTNTHRMDLVAGLNLWQEEGVLSILEEGIYPPVHLHPQISSRTVLGGPGSIQLCDGISMNLELLDIGSISTEYWQRAMSSEAWLDSDRIQFPLTIRTILPGDRINLLGAGGHTTKVSDVFINHRVPLSARKAYPLVCSGGAVVWIPNIRISDLAKITPATTRLVHIWLAEEKPHPDNNK